MFSNTAKEQNPIIIKCLQNNKISQLIKIMMNRKISEEYLIKYGAKGQQSLKNSEEDKVSKHMVQRFTVQQIVLLKGSQKDNVKYYYNSTIQQFLYIKLRLDQALSNEDRRIGWMQLTQIFQLSNLYRGLSELQVPYDVRNQIKKDVLRTYISPQLTINQSKQMKQKQQIIFRDRITQILNILATYNPFMGYCQGLNTICAFLVQEKFTNQEIFFIFKKITEEILPCDYYTSMDSTVIFVKILYQILYLTHPKIHNTLQNIMKANQGQGFVIVLSFVFRWFVEIFTNNNLKRQIRLRIMDYFIVEGVTTLFKASLAFFDYFQKQILKVSTLQQYLPLTEKLMRQFDNIELLNSRLKNTYINKTILLLLKEKLMITTQNKRERQCKTSCNPKWNSCLQQIQNHMAEGKKYDYFVFKSHQNVNLIHNYFEKIHKQYFNINKAKNLLDQLKFGRMVHVCRQNSTTSHTQDDSSQKSRQNIQLSIKSNIIGKLIRPQVPDFTKKYEIEAEQNKKKVIRNKAIQNLQKRIQNSDRKSVFNRSQSVQFMKNMIKNVSFNNLLQILQVEERNNLFRDILEDEDDD